MTRDYSSLTLEEWASLSLPEIQKAEFEIYGEVFSRNRLNTDAPSKARKREKALTTVPTKAELAGQLAGQPAWPVDQKPDPRWSDDQMTAFIQHADLDQQPVAELLDMNDLTDHQLDQLANATTRDEAAAIEDQIRAKRRRST